MSNRPQRKRLTFLFIIAVVGAICLFGLILRKPSFLFPSREKHDTRFIDTAYEKCLSNIHVTGSGTVLHILPDDTRGSRHQRFILRLPSGRTLLIAHNIDLAPRIKNLKRGDTVEFSGEYKWNPKGGIVHWTHHDSSGRHRGGWLKHNGKVYK